MDIIFQLVTFILESLEIKKADSAILNNNKLVTILGELDSLFEQYLKY